MFYLFLIMPYIVLPFMYQFPATNPLVTWLQMATAEVVRGFPNYWAGLYYNIPVYYDTKELYMTIVIIIVAIYLLMNWKKRAIKVNIVYMILGALLVLMLLQYSYSADPYSGLKSCKGVFLIIISGLYFSNLSKKTLMIVANGVALFALIDSIIGLLQLFMVWYKWFPYLEVPGQGSNGYIFGTIGHINQFANMLTMSLFVVVALFFLSKCNWRKLCYFIIIALTLFNIILTTCRSAWVAVLLTSILFLIFHWKHLIQAKQLKWVGVFILLLILELGVLKFMTEHMQNNPVLGNHAYKTSAEQVDSTHGRTLLWEKNLLFISEHPILGVGTGGYWAEEQAYYQQTVNQINSTPDMTQVQADDMIKFASIKEHSHNEYLQQFVENGILGFVLLVVLVLGILASYVKLNKINSSLENSLFFFGMFSCCFIACFDFPWHMIHTITWFAMLLGCYVAYMNVNNVFTNFKESSLNKKKLK